MQPPEQKDEGQVALAWLDQWRGTLVWAMIVAAIILIGRLTPFKPVRGFFGGFGWVTEQALRLTKEVFERYGELAVFLGPLLENTIFLGAFIPGTLVMLLAGVATQDGLVDLRLAIPLGILGAMIGDTISYGIGLFGWQRLGPESRLVRWSEQMREPLLHHSIWLVLSYHFAGYSRLIGPAAAGFLRMPLLRWMLLDYIGVALWVSVFIMAGYLLGMAGLSLDDSSERSVRIFEVIIFLLFAIGVIVVMRQANRRRARHEEPSPTAEPPPTDGQQPLASAVLDPADPTSEEQRRTGVR